MNIEEPKKVGPYLILKVLGHGGFGTVYLGREPKTFLCYAIKVSEDRESLRKEYKMLRYLKTKLNYINIYEYGTEDKLDYFVMELLGTGIEMFKKNKPFSVECVSGIGLEILECLEKIHENGVIHRDVKPSQFIVSRNKQNIKLIDFGLSSFYIDKGEHKPFKTKCKLRGNALFASINTHMGFSHSRRDDLESLTYSLIYLINGQLPWLSDQKSKGAGNWRVILKRKLEVIDEILLQKAPVEYLILLNYTKKLFYNQTPNYGYMKSLLKKYVRTEKIYFCFDWNKSRDARRKSIYCSDDENDDNQIKRVDSKLLSKRRGAKINPLIIAKIGQVIDKERSKNKAKSVKSIFFPVDLAIGKDIKGFVDRSEEIQSPDKVKKKSKRARYHTEINKKIADTKLKELVLAKNNLSSGLAEKIEQKYSDTKESVTFAEASDECMTERGDLPEMKDRNMLAKYKEGLKTQDASIDKLCIIA